MKIAPTRSKNDGFTIIELVVVIVVSGILAIGTVAFIARTVEGVDAASNRNQIASAGRAAIDRMALELHNALPNSIRASIATAGGDQCIEYIPVIAATTYINPSFSGIGTTSFDVVNFVEDGAAVYPAAPPSLYAVIYPRNRNQLYDGDNGAVVDWPNFPNRRPIQRIAAAGGIVANGADLSTITVDPIDAGTTTHRFRRRSPNERFFVVQEPVSFCVTGDKLYRYTNYGFYAAQSTTEEVLGVCPGAALNRCLPDLTSAPDKKLIVDNINNTGLTAFTVGNQNLARNSLVAIQLNMSLGSESISLNHEVLTRSVP